MTGPRPRAACAGHGRYTTGCTGCRAARRIYDAWVNSADESDGRWAVRLVGDFTAAGQVHILPARDEGYAWRRAAWWRNYRTDVLVEVLCRADRGAPWVVADEQADAAEVEAIELRDRECWRFGCRLHVGDRDSRAAG